MIHWTVAAVIAWGAFMLGFFLAALMGAGRCD